VRVDATSSDKIGIATVSVEKNCVVSTEPGLTNAQAAEVADWMRLSS